MTTKQKLKQYVDYKGISMREFSRIIKVSDSYLRTKGSITTDKLPPLKENFPDLNMNWLLFGLGEMIKSSEENNNPNEIKILKEEVVILKSAIASLLLDMDDIKERIKKANIK